VTDSIHRTVDVGGVESSSTPSPTPRGHRPRRGRWIAGAAAVAALGATAAVLVLRDDDSKPASTPPVTTSAIDGSGPALRAEQRQSIPPAMQESADRRQTLREAAERAQIAEWAGANGLTGLSPASLTAG
jgi:hypothetical protein